KPFAIVCVNPKVIGAQPNEVPNECFTVAFPVKDLEAMAKHFGLTKNDLKPGKIVEAKTIPGVLGNRPTYVVLNRNHCHIGFHEAALKRVTKTKRLSAELKPTQRKLLGGADGLLHLGTEAWGELWTTFLKDVESGFDVGGDEEEKKAAKELFAALAGVRFGMM